ncbi:MAG: molybdopterin molybdotransferase MoeA [Deltaproteobacteria bacterium]|nr:molybdopterin molybdotransferase MoeA [Deltaproteobacteria bacterium]
MSTTPTNVSLEEMIALLDGALGDHRLPTLTLPVRGALGRVLAAEQHARLDLPPFDKSAMDGYAILAGDEAGAHRVLGRVAAGDAAPQVLEPGTTVKVMTGAPVPAGAARVVMQEHAHEEDGAVVFTVPAPSSSTNICARGEDLRRGERVLAAGRRLGPLEVANLVASGVTEVEVARPLRLALFSTGDEVVRDPADLTPGKILDTNTPLLEALAPRFGLELVRSEHLPDDREATAAGIRAGLAEADLVTLSGGISTGDFDHVQGALSDLGLRLLFSGVKIKPGRPLSAAATADHRLVIGLPGNPVAVFLTFQLCLLHVARRLSGEVDATPELVLPLGRPFRRKKAHRQEYVPARLDEARRPVPVEFHGSAHLAALMEADGFFVVPPGPGQLDEGAPVRFLPFR